MKASFERKVLLAAARSCLEAIPAKTTMPVLSHVRLSVNDKQCELYATDTEVAIAARLSSLAVLQPGQTLIPAKALYDLLNASPAQELEISADNTEIKLQMRSGSKASYTIPAHNSPDSLPDWDFTPATAYHTVKADDLARAIALASFAMAAKEGGRPYLTGMYFAFSPAALACYGSDSKCTSWVTIPATEVGQHSKSWPNALLPPKFTGIISRRDPGDEPAVIQVNDTSVSFCTGKLSCGSRRMVGRYVSVEDILTRIFNTPSYEVKLDTKKFRALVQQAAVLSNEAERSMKLTLSPAQIILHGTGSIVETEIPFSGLPHTIEMLVNPIYVIANLNQMIHSDCDEFFLRVVDHPDYPLMFRVPDLYFHVIMPMGIKEGK